MPIFEVEIVKEFVTRVYIDADYAEEITRNVIDNIQFGDLDNDSWSDGDTWYFKAPRETSLSKDTDIIDYYDVKEWGY